MGKFEKGHPFYGWDPSLEEERRRKISEKKKGHPYHPVKSPETERLRREKIRAAKLGKPRPDMMGKGNPRWADGDPDERLRRGREADEWQRKVFERDNHVCQFCGSRVRLHAHHILHYDDYPEERFDVDNGISLCHRCRMLMHSITDYRLESFTP
jgi:hypothetical protein